MSTLNLSATSRAYLTRTVTTPNPSGTGPEIVTSYPCDLAGNALIGGAPPLPVYRDVFTGKTFVRVAENIPTGTLAADKIEAARLNSLAPIHYVSPDGDVKGWFVEAPDFNNREGQPGVSTVAEHPLVLVPAAEQGIATAIQSKESAL